MLTREHRLTQGSGFTLAVRRGRRAGGRTLVVHLHDPHDGRGDHAGESARVGLVVSKAVGPAVTRNQVKRRLRHLLRERVPLLPAGSVLVVRALPAAAQAPSSALAADLDRALARVGGTP